MKAYEIRQPDGTGKATLCTSQRSEGWYVEVYLHEIDHSMGKGPFDTEAAANDEIETIARELPEVMGAMFGADVELHELTPDEIAAARGN
jgi:hypothetical protein